MRDLVAQALGRRDRHADAAARASELEHLVDRIQSHAIGRHRDRDICREEPDASPDEFDLEPYRPQWTTRIRLELHVTVFADTGLTARHALRTLQVTFGDDTASEVTTPLVLEVLHLRETTVVNPQASADDTRIA